MQAERILPRLVADVEAAAQAAGLDDQAVRMHVTGCPNGRARPYTAELGIVGRTKRTYDVYVGGSVAGDRLNLRLGTDVRVEQLRPLFIGLFERFAASARRARPSGTSVPAPAWANWPTRCPSWHLRRTVEPA